MSLSDWPSAIYVRGGAPGQNLYLVDGAQVYDPEHTFGLFSTFNTYAIKQANVLKGGFGPQYDDRLPSVIDVIDKEGNRNRFQGALDISLLAANVTFEAPLGSISGSIRRTYLDQVYGRFVKDFSPCYFVDGNLKTFLHLTDRDVLTLSAFNNTDNMNYSTSPPASNEDRNLVLRWGNTVGSVSRRHLFGDRLASSMYLTYSGFISGLLVDVQPANAAELNNLSDYTLCEGLTYYASDRATLDAGVEYKKVNVYYSDDVGYGAAILSAINFEVPAYVNLE